MNIFLLTRPSRDVTHTGCRSIHKQSNFYSHAPRGTWPKWPEGTIRIKKFLLTRPSRDVTRSPAHFSGRHKFLLTRPSRDVTEVNMKTNIDITISTHTPLAGRDSDLWKYFLISVISTHTPLAGRDTAGANTGRRSKDFYSHAPRGTWLLKTSQLKDRQYFYSHAPRGTWLKSFLFASPGRYFYSHAPRGTWLVPVEGHTQTHKYILTRPSRD